MNEITFQRFLGFYLTERTIKSYENFSGKQVKLLDNLLGENGWCDFVGPTEWGECTNIYQNHVEAEYLFQNLFEISDIKEVERLYGVKIKPDSIPKLKGLNMRESKIDTKSRIRDGLDKKLKKIYPHDQNSYTEKGVLIVGIFDTFFSGFKKDIEISTSYLIALADDFKPQLADSSFDRVLLVDAMSPFDQDPDNLTYWLYRVE